ncbi:hypothetical protein [Vitreoscilla filiformis]|nr:hypothetical protein [Vitreoscilla filiformis]
MTALSPPERLRLMLRFDPGSGVCLWAIDDTTRAALGDGAVEVERLPLDANLRHRLWHLIAWFDTSIDWNDPLQPGPFWSAAEAERFQHACQDTLAALRHALPPDRYEVLDDPQAATGSTA